MDTPEELNIIEHTTPPPITPQPVEEAPASSEGEGNVSDATSEAPEAGETFDLRDFFFDEDEAAASSAASAAAASSTASTTDSPPASTRARRRRRRRDTFVLVDELPEGVDFDEPVEVEKLTRIGRFLNFVVSFTLVVFLVVALLVIGNAAMTVVAVFNFPMPEKIYVSITDLDQPVAKLDLTVQMPETFYTRFLSFEKDRMTPLIVDVYLPPPDRHFDRVEELTDDDKVCTLFYDDSSSKEMSKISFNSLVSNEIKVEGVQLKLNPRFDAGRLGLLLEDKKHPQRPKMYVVRPNLELMVKPILIPFSIGIQQPYTGMLDVEAGPSLQSEIMSQFNFNPSEIHFSTADDGSSVHVSLAQPLPKCLMGTGMHIEAALPPLNLQVSAYEFPFEKKSERFSFEALSKISQPLAKVPLAQKWRHLITNDFFSL